MRYWFGSGLAVLPNNAPAWARSSERTQKWIMEPHNHTHMSKASKPDVITATRRSDIITIPRAGTIARAKAQRAAPKANTIHDMSKHNNVYIALTLHQYCIIRLNDLLRRTLPPASKHGRKNLQTKQQNGQTPKVQTNHATTKDNAMTCMGNNSLLGSIFLC